MKIENQVCTLDQAKRLRELGVMHSQRPTIFFTGEQPVVYGQAKIGRPVVAAFTAAELGEMLPSEITTEREPGEEQHVWVCSDSMNWNVAFPADTEAKAKAQMLIWLLEKAHELPEHVNARLAVA